MKDLVVSILEPVLSIFVIGYTLIGFLFGGAMDSLLSGGFFRGESSFHLGWALVGGFAFFIIAVIGTGAIFTLLSIRELLEQQLSSLRALERSRQP